jgi:hypothetical protein
MIWEVIKMKNNFLEVMNNQLKILTGIALKIH